jgi:hypothetical protein
VGRAGRAGAPTARSRRRRRPDSERLPARTSAEGPGPGARARSCRGSVRRVGRAGSRSHYGPPVSGALVLVPGQGHRDGRLAGLVGRADSGPARARNVYY